MYTIYIFLKEVVDVKSSDEFWWIQIDLGAFENGLLKSRKILGIS